ncbi:MAG: hypothetical protein IBJ11_11245 [Phycisphaerales bacterium]|nr:hypothetical protein [Phycisphaerales bacterium]
MRTSDSRAAIGAELDRLRERVSEVERRTSSRSVGVPTGWEALDGVLPGGGLHLGALHEWVGLEGISGESESRRWSPPLGVLVHLVWRAARWASGDGVALSVVWVGRRVWPTAQALASDERAGGDGGGGGRGWGWGEARLVRKDRRRVAVEPAEQSGKLKA